MEIDEAIEVIKEQIPLLRVTLKPKAMAAIREVLKQAEKQTPKKVKSVPYFYGYISYCPNCEKAIEETHVCVMPQYCNKCGQKLDWS